MHWNHQEQTCIQSKLILGQANDELRATQLPVCLKIK